MGTPAAAASIIGSPLPSVSLGSNTKEATPYISPIPTGFLNLSLNEGLSNSLNKKPRKILLLTSGCKFDTINLKFSRRSIK